jgi:hypothetical protein
MRFLDELTVCSLRPALELRIQCYPKWSDARIVEQCVEDAIEEFGAPTRADDPLVREWTLSSDQQMQAVAFSLHDASRPKQPIGPTWLSFSYDFWWKPHPTLPVMDCPGEGSYLGVIHGGGKLFLQPTFRFPFGDTSQAFTEFIGHIQMHLPFQVREANFQSMRPSAKALRPQFRKLPTGWLGTPAKR